MSRRGLHVLDVGRMCVMSAFSKIGRTLAAGMMSATLAGPVMAADDLASGAPPPQAAAEAAQAKADAANTQAAKLEQQGGWPYKTGRLEEKTQEAARWQARADDLQAEASGVPEPVVPPSPDLQAAQDRVSDLRAEGGWPYKTGTMQRAENDVQALTPQAVEETAAPPAPEPTTWA